MEKEEKIIKKKSDLNAKGMFDFRKLERLKDPFILAKFTEKGEDVEITYDMKELKNVKELKKENLQNKYRFLMNFGRLSEEWKNYKFSMETSNVFYDSNYLPKVQMRDLYKVEEMKHKEEKKVEFVEAYKCYIGGMLGGNYTVEQLQQSGISILKDEKSFEKIYNCKTKEEIETELKQRYLRAVEREKQTKILVPRNVNIIKTVVSIASSLLLFVFIALFVWTNFFKLNDANTVVTAMEAYVEKDYVGCIKSLKKVSVSDMDKNTKYILATSYAKTENLKKKEIQSIVDRLDTNSDERELEYWIYLGRLKTNKAEDLAKAMSDDQLLIYSYMKERSVLEQDTSKSGDKKQARLKELDENIKELGDKYSEDDKDSKETSKDEQSKDNQEQDKKDQANQDQANQDQDQQQSAPVAQ
ncbi:type VII secretion protein EssB/YukC [Lachnobacterium bovis]|uniref:type VII secretion protein EssB/YukC n=1 Tax=Lachnobacterium bovis TaxID=140626 RepID=UPI000490800B|nr:type VII secretion protein EssB/YukC [Lachnobacterium bovis]